jgi:hypothetical protein
MGNGSLKTFDSLDISGKDGTGGIIDNFGMRIDFIFDFPRCLLPQRFNSLPKILPSSCIQLPAYW